MNTLFFNPEKEEDKLSNSVVVRRSFLNPKLPFLSPVAETGLLSISGPPVCITI